MDTKTRLQDSLKDAIRSNDEARKRTIRLAMATIRLAEVEKRSPLNEAEQIGIIQKEIKGRREAIQDAQKAIRPDLVAEAEGDIRILEEFLPQQLTKEELQKLVEQAIAETGASNPAETGKVMKVILPRIQGRAPNDQVSQLVKGLLTKP